MLTLLAWRNFRLQLHRFQVILSALALGFAALLLMLSVTSGMTQTLREKAARYFAGDVSVFSLASDRVFTEGNSVVTMIKETAGYKSLTRRTEYNGGDSSLYFGGESMRQRKLIGIDWTVEGANFATMDWVSGGVPAIDDPVGILVSLATAQRLKLRFGDEVTVVFDTKSGQRNSLSLIVRGIFRDTSFFGYASYINQQTLNRAMGLPDQAVTSLGAVLVPGTSYRQFGEALVQKLGQRFVTLPLIADREERSEVRSDRQAELGVMTLEANLAQIDDILNSILTVTWLVCGLFLFILVIGVGNTYRMIVFERTSEIGTMRALGLTRPRLLALLVIESIFLGAAGVGLGTVVGGLLLLLVQTLDFSENTLVLLFLSEGHVKPWLPVGPYVLAAGALLASTVLGALLPARNAAKLRPVDALREGE